MCCTAKENICFFLSDRLFCCHFDGLIVLLKFSSSSAETSYDLFLRKLRYRHNLFLPLVWPTKRGREQSVERASAILLPAIFLYVGHTSKVWISARQFFSTFLFWYFLFLEAVVKAALFVVGEVGAIQVVINPSPVYLRHLRLV